MRTMSILKRLSPLFLIAWISLSGVPLPGYTSITSPINLFLDRVVQQSTCDKIIFTGIDPGNPGNPNAGAKELAEVRDTNGTLGHISAQSPGFWRWVGKGLLVVGGTAGGIVGGASVGAVTLPIVGSVPGAVVGGVGGCSIAVGDAILRNTGGSNPRLTQDIGIYDQLIIETGSGDLDLRAAIISAVLNDPAVETFTLPGGAILLRPGSALFAGSMIVDEFNVQLPNGQVEVGIIDVDGNLASASDRMVAVFFQDLVRGILLTDQVKLFLDNVVPPGALSDGNPVRSRHIFAQSVASCSSDSTRPSFAISGPNTNPQGQKFVQIAVQDTGSGLSAIHVVRTVNTTVTIPSFTSGTQAPVTVTATKIDQSLSSQVELRAHDRECNCTIGDPVLTTVIRETGKPVTETLTGIPQRESKISVHNAGPGLKKLNIAVNGIKFQMAGLRDNEVRRIDVSSAMMAGSNNSISLTAHGKPGGSAVIMIHE